MIIERHNKSRTEMRPENSKANIVFDIVTLTSFCKYLVTRNGKVRKRHLLNMKSVLEVIDRSLYINDPEKMKRLHFLDCALDMRINRRIDEPNIIFLEASKQMGDRFDFINLNDYELDSNVMQWVSDVVTETLNYSFVYSYIDEMQEICTRLKATDYNNRGSIIKEFEVLNDKIKNAFRKNRVDSLNDMTFSLRDGVFEESITDTYNLITSPNRRLLTGMQGLNEIIGGGFENSRVYMFLGLAAVGKSMLLLNLINQIKKYNTNYVPKDPTKIPCILLLTMENSVVETINRLFSITTGDTLANCNSADEAIHRLRTEGGLVINDNSPIDIIVKYKPNRSVDTNYLYALYDDLADDGYEVICLMQDHVKRIKSAYRHSQSEIRLELGDVVNEFKSFANEKDIPVISVSHLNREADKILENVRNSNKCIDGTKLLGKSVVGESFLMIDNLDFGANINIDEDDNGNRYMCFNACKQRDNASKSYVAIPFMPHSKILLAEDLYNHMPVYKESIHESPLMKFTRDGSMKPYKYSGMYISADDDFDEDKVEEEVVDNRKVIPKFSNRLIIINEDDDEEIDVSAYLDYAEMDMKTKSEPAPPVPTKPKELQQGIYFMPVLPKVIKPGIYFFDDEKKKN